MDDDWPLELSRAVVRSVPTTLLELSLDGVVQYANPEAKRILGGGDLRGCELVELVDERDRERFSAFLERCAADASGGSAYLPGVSVQCGDIVRRMDAACRAHPPIAGLRGLALALVDVSEHEQLLAELGRSATTDPLTGLGNRALLHDVGEQVGASLGGSVLMLDVDGFKNVNDVHGHAAGDEVLSGLGARLAAALPTDGSAYRIGGDEFVVLLPGRSSRAALMLAHTLRTAAALPTTVITPERGSVELAVTVTIGVADLDARGIPDALGRADRALYEGKTAGGGRVVVHDAAQRSVRQRGRDIQTEMLRLVADNARLQREAREDAGTGLPNVRALFEELDLMHDSAVAGGATYGLVFIDLDHFGLVNKRHGDAAGDEVLRRVADVLAGVRRSTDRLYRKGGEELVVLVPDADLDEALAVAERMRSALEAAAIPHGGRDDLATVTASFGATVGGALPGSDARTSLALGALCMLRAKENGRNRVASRPLDVHGR
jgi:diguanylate cyclase (GGDEF)-like protein